MERSKAIDMAKGLSLLTLPAIHSTLFFSNSEVFASPFGLTLAFIAETIGAPVFLLTMGWSISINPPKSARRIVIRSVKLFIVGYFLNFLKFGIPYLTNGIPEALYLENKIPHNVGGLVRLLLIGDILQLASISYFICAMLHRYKSNIGYSVFMAIIVLLITPLTWQMHSNNTIVNFFFSLFCGVPPQTFFPVFPWLIYPAAGLILGYFRISKDNKKTYWWIAIAILIVGIGCATIEPVEWKSNYYRLGPGSTLYHIGVALIFLLVCDGLIKIGQLSNFSDWLYVLSSNVTVVYIIQWVVVCWTLPLFTYHQLTLGQTFLAVVINTCLTIFFSTIYAKYRKQWKQSLILQG
jgi:hypothetical protein